MIRSTVLFIGLILCTCNLYGQQSLADSIGQAATDFIDSVSPAEKQICLFSFSDPDRRNWSNEPENMHPRKGLKLADMTTGQKKLLHRLLQTVLSEQGYLKVLNVIRLDDWLKKNFYKPPAAQFYGEGLYRLAFFGLPGRDQNWGWRFEGHHLSINITVMGEKVSATPFFLGSHPAVMPDGMLAGMENLFSETRLAYQFIHSLSPAQLTRAVKSKTPPSDIVIRTTKEPELKADAGLPATELNTQQKKLLSALVSSYTGNLKPSLANRYQQVTGNGSWKNFRIVWMGSLQPGQPAYYRLWSPDGLVIEYCSRMHDANHIHTLLDDIPTNFGGASAP